MRKGTLFTVVGPSGVGKDSILNAAKNKVDAYFPKRYISRSAEVDNEDFIKVDQSQIDILLKEKRVAIHWYAHNNFYGIPIDIIYHLNKGTNVIFNGSRHAIKGYKQQFPELKIIYIDAKEEIVLERLKKRARENAKDIQLRLKRAKFDIPTGSIIIKNEDDLDKAVIQLLSVMH